MNPAEGKLATVNNIKKKEVDLSCEKPENNVLHFGHEYNDAKQRKKTGLGFPWKNTPPGSNNDTIPISDRTLCCNTLYKYFAAAIQVHFSCVLIQEC